MIRKSSFGFSEKAMRKRTVRDPFSFNQKPKSL